MIERPMNAYDVYAGSDGELTKQFYEELQRRGPLGVIAMNLFRAQKCSSRAKVYRGGRGGRRFRDMAYERKEWSLKLLTEALQQHAGAFGIVFGWGRDDAQNLNPWVLYVELPDIGQVSFHSPTRHVGPDYPSEWDGQHLSAERVIKFCQVVYGQAGREAKPADSPCV